MPLQPEAEPFAADGGPVGALVCHGFTGMPASVRPWGEHLAAAGLSVRVPRLPGHGTRWQDANITRWEDWYLEVSHAFDELTNRCQQVFTMGLSLGGTLALRLAEERGADVAGVVVVNPHLVNTRWDARFVLPVLRFVLPSYPGISSDIKKPGVTEPAYDRTPVRAAWSAVQFGGVVRSELAKVTQPLLVFGSREDHLVDPVNRRILMDECASTDKEYVELPDSYHVATMDNDAPTIFERSLQFVRAHVPAGTGT